MARTISITATLDLSTSNSLPTQHYVLDSILPYCEKSSMFSLNGQNVERLGAHDLFGLFTADIIKEKVSFIR